MDSSRKREKDLTFFTSRNLAWAEFAVSLLRDEEPRQSNIHIHGSIYNIDKRKTLYTLTKS
jgi:hypothetical protein